jgi:hypothetical protein
MNQRLLGNISDLEIGDNSLTLDYLRFDNSETYFGKVHFHESSDIRSAYDWLSCFFEYQQYGNRKIVDLKKYKFLEKTDFSITAKTILEDQIEIVKQFKWSRSRLSFRSEISLGRFNINGVIRMGGITVVLDITKENYLAINTGGIGTDWYRIEDNISFSKPLNLIISNKGLISLPEKYLSIKSGNELYNIRFVSKTAIFILIDTIKQREKLILQITPSFSEIDDTFKQKSLSYVSVSWDLEKVQ